MREGFKNISKNTKTDCKANQVKFCSATVCFKQGSRYCAVGSKFCVEFALTLRFNGTLTKLE